MKYYLTLLAIALLFGLSSCVNRSERTTITVSIAPEKFFVERIAGSGYDVHVLVPAGNNPETYDPTPKDIAAVAHSTLYFYMGSLPFERIWLQAIEEQNSSLRSIDISTYLPELKHIHSHGDGHVHGDPHFWSSFQGAIAITKGVYEALVEEFPTDTELFTANYQKLLDEIHALQEECSTLMGQLEQCNFVIYHPSLSYFAEEWHMEQIAIEQHGKEPTPQHLASLIDYAKEKGVKLVFIQQEFDTKNAHIVAEEIGARIVEINPLDEDWAGQMRLLIDAFRPQ